LHFPWNVKRSYLAKCARKTTATRGNSIPAKKIQPKGGVAWGMGGGGTAALLRFEVNVQSMQPGSIYYDLMRSLREIGGLWSGW